MENQTKFIVETRSSIVEGGKIYKGVPTKKTFLSFDMAKGYIEALTEELKERGENKVYYASVHEIRQIQLNDLIYSPSK